MLAYNDQLVNLAGSNIALFTQLNAEVSTINVSDIFNRSAPFKHTARSFQGPSRSLGRISKVDTFTKPNPRSLCLASSVCQDVTLPMPTFRLAMLVRLTA